jgi:DNA polymerase I-like protein with 3'-5' exonuclease and polymerase domains
MVRRIKLRKKGKKRPILQTNLPHVGSLDAPVYMILDPVVGNLGAKTPLSKTQMEWFANHAAKSGGFKKSDVCIISCAPPLTKETWDLGKLTNDHLKANRDDLMALIKANSPKFIMPFGAKACQQLMGRAVQITKVRGQPMQEDNMVFGIPMLPMLSPFFAHRSPENEAAFKADMRTAGRIAAADFDLDASAIDYKHDYQWCYDLDWLIKKRPKLLSVDLETVGLTAFDPSTTILTMQLTWEDGKSVVVPINYDRGKLRHHKFIDWDNINRPKLMRQIKKLMEDPRIEKVGQNLKFDWMFLWYKEGIRMENYAHDTMLLAHLLDENQRRININDLVKQHVPLMAGFNDAHEIDPDHHGKSRMDLYPPDKMLEYSGGDTDACWRLFHVLHEKVQEDGMLYQCYDKVTMPAQRAFCDIELNGFAVSKKQLTEFEIMLRGVQKRERLWLLRQIPKSIKDKHRGTGVGVKVSRRVILVDWLYEHKDGLKLKPVAFTKTKQPSISSKDALPYYVADHPVLARLIDYIKNDKLLNTYAKGFHKYIFDGLLRPSYKLANTVTGRSASADPNGQNFPKRGKLAKEFLKFFEAPKGWVYMACDLSQAELRIAAIMSGDPTMLKVYADGGDIHRQTAAGTMGITVDEFLKLPHDVQALKRFQAKAVNFGFLYGMWWVKFRSYAKTDYGIDFTEDEAKAIRTNFFKTYPMLEHWHDEVQQLVTRLPNDGGGMIRTLDGRIRHLPNVYSPDEGIAKQAMRQAINSPVQAIASDLGLISLGRLLPHIRKEGIDEWLKPCGFIHDAIVCLVREERAAEGCTLVKHFMENNPLHEWFDWEPEIPILADAEVGRSLAQTYELKPEQFNNKKRSYTDLIGDEFSSLSTKAATETDRDKKVALLQSIAKLQLDIEMSGALPSPTKVKRRKITLNQGSKHATPKATKAPSRRRVKVRQDSANGQGRGERSKPRKNRLEKLG